ncbi:MAG: hypothetical protein AAF371_11715 [Pseudomonadota bacterium]
MAGLTSVVGAFFVKDYLSLSARPLAGLTFWLGLRWVLEIRLCDLVDLFRRREALLVLLGAGHIVVAVIGVTAPMTAIFVAQRSAIRTSD